VSEPSLSESTFSDSTFSDSDTTPSTQPDSTPTASRRRSSWRGPRIAALTVGVLVVGLIALLATRETAITRAKASPLLGSVAPDLNGVDLLSGEPVRLSDSAGKWTVVNFFASWCTPCVAEHDDLAKFYADDVVNGDDALFAAVFAEPKADVLKFFNKREGGWPVITDPKAAIDFGVTAVPETYIVAPNGVIAASVRGGVDYESLVGELAELKRQYALANQ
jgi:cytochrome c biogenesis protein CcmG, thiol:disulfide interchange protein DsbE